MPSIDAKVDKRNILDQGTANGVDLSKLAKQVDTSNPATMPCSPYDKCSQILQESVPPGYCISPPSKSNGVIYTKSVQAGPNMAPVERPSENLERSLKMPQPVKDAKAGKGEKPTQEMTNSKAKKPKPRSFELLECDYKVSEGYGCLVRHKSVTNSYKKKTYKLNHAVSAPAAISDAMEPLVENEVFADEEEQKECLTDHSPGEPSDTKTDKAGESGQDDKDEKVIREEEKLGEESREHPDSNITEKTESGEGGKMGKTDAEKDAEDDNEKPKMEKAATDIEALTQDLEINLHLKDNSDKEKKDDGIEAKDKDVSSLADDLQVSLSLGQKQDKKAIIKEEGRHIRAIERNVPRLRSKGIQKQDVFGRSDDAMMTDHTFTQQQQWMPSQPTSSALNWQMGPQQQQTLPPVQYLLKPLMGSSNQFNQSVVCPPGQSNPSRMVFMTPSGPMYKLGQSMQTQHAQHNVCFGNSAPPPRFHQQNNLQSSGPMAPFVSPQRMNIPGESTGRPSEADWPPTPESSVDDILDIIESDTESVRSPVESEEPMTGTFMDMIGVPSPQSSWDGSHAPSISSVSPVPSPFSVLDHQQASPAQQVPDFNGPWSPVSNLSSQGEPPSPNGSTVIKVTGHMTMGTVTISPMSPHPPCKRQRNGSNTDSREAQQRITNIKSFLKEDPNTSPPYLANWHSPPQVQPYPPNLAPQQTQTPPEGELEAYRKHLEGWTLPALMEQDEDGDTVLHIAICQTKISLSLAIIERLCKRKECLNVVNHLEQTALYLSVVSNLPELTQILINYGADLFICNEKGNTLLHAASRSGNNDAIKAICEGISYCSYMYSEEVARELFDLTNYAGKTALMLAVENHGTLNAAGEVINCADTVAHLLQSFASARQPDFKSGKTALHYAVELHKIDLIFILLDNCDDPGSLVNQQMYDGNTALHLIVGRNRPEQEIINIVNLLMTRGANVGLENAARQKPYDLVHREHQEIIRRLHGQGNRKR